MSSIGKAKYPLLDSGVTPGTYALATLIIDRKGRATAAVSAATTGTGSVVLATNPVIAAPTIADLTNMTHIHQSAASGGSLDAAAIGSGQLALARGGTGVDLSAAGSATAILAQDASHVISARALIAADIPTLTLAKISDAGTMAAQNANAVAITGGAIDGTTVGSTTRSTGKFSTVTATTAVIDGTAGAGYLELAVSSAPSAPTSAIRVFADASNRFSWKGPNGFVRTFDGTANTADRIYVLPDAAGAVVLDTATQTLTNKTLAGPIITATTRFVGPILAPAADSTAALKLTKADGSTAVMTVDTTNGQVGIGTTPSANATLHIVKDGGLAVLNVDAYNTGPRSILFFRTARGTLASPANVVNGDLTGEFVGAGYAGGAFRNAAAMNFVVGTGTISSGSLPSEIYFETTPDGSVTRVERMRISSIGVVTVKATDAAIAAVTDVLIIDHSTSGTPAASYGTGLRFRGQDSTTPSQEMGRVRTVWTDPAHLSRASKMVLSAYNVGSEVDVLTLSSPAGVATALIGANISIVDASGGRTILVTNGVKVGNSSGTSFLLTTNTATTLSASTTLNLAAGTATAFTTSVTIDAVGTAPSSTTMNFPALRNDGAKSAIIRTGDFTSAGATPVDMYIFAGSELGTPTQGKLILAHDGTNPRGRVGIGTTSPSGLLDVNDDHIRVRTAKTPATAGAAGNQGDIAWDSSFFYICVAASTWRRTAHATW